MPPAPPPISTGDPGSFAMRTITERKPRIIAQVLGANRLSAHARGSLDALAEEIRCGAVTDPFAGRSFPPGAFAGEERSAWEAEIARHVGRPWLDIPWYFAEACFYLRVLLACGYYDTPPGTADPFQAAKDEELAGPRGGLELARQVAQIAEGIAAEVEARAFLLHSALWGNRVDLGCFELDESRRREVFLHDRDNLVVDDADEVVAALGRAQRLDMILDNAGSELACDLLLAERLLSEGPPACRTVTLHVKASPFFVSDAMGKDVRATITAFSSDGDPRLARIGSRLEGALTAGRLAIRGHWFWNSPLHFPRMPADIREPMSAADIVVVKGDANYRRLLEDRKWPTCSRMEEIAGYFPSAFACLRTMKSEIVVDVPRERAARLGAEDPAWLTNGRRGLVRLCRPVAVGA
jgi:hypothetical protein